MHVIDHFKGKPTNEKRNVLVESARIARGEIKDIAEVNTDEIDGLIVPGGFGAAKNLSDFAVNGETCKVHPDVVRLIREFVSKQKITCL